MKTILISAALVVAPIAASAATILIDEFTSSQVVADAPIGSYSRTSEVADAAVLGGYREITVRKGGRGGPFATTMSSNAGGERRLNFSNQSRSAGTGTVLYDGRGHAGLGGVDLAMGDADARFRFTVKNADASMTVASTVTDTAGGTSTLTQAFPRTIEGSAIIFAFADYAGDVDFASVDSIAFTFSGPADLDASFDRLMALNNEVTTVPLPAGGALLAGGLLALASRRRRDA